MKISEQWLRQFVNPALTTAELTHQMTMIGLSIESFEPVAGAFSGVVIGEVLATRQHPNADKLTCCDVSIGSDQPLHIVCGAPNVRAGLKVAVATVGAVLPGDFKIKEAKLRGELSQGMLCSAKELQLKLGHSEADGIIELPCDAKIGDDFRAYFKAEDHIIDIEITPNRGDCLGVYGVARDIATANTLAISPMSVAKVPSKSAAHFSVSVDAPEDCPRYAGRVIRAVNNHVQTPSYMQHALQRAGIRLINPVVDVCNFVMLELGQPMHAFDLSTLSNKVVVRRAKPTEKLTLLDEREITLTADDVVIADENKPHALAGIMGGLHSAVSNTTCDIFLEAAFFTPKTVCLSKRRHNANSDSSYRFERGVDFNLPVVAIERATQLIMDMAGGEPADVIEVVSENHLPRRDAIILKHSDIQRIVGISIASEKVVAILHALGMQVKAVDSHYEVIPPSYRFDMALSIDLIEELARMTGYNDIPAADMVAPLLMQSAVESKLCDKRIRQFCVDRDYHEAMTYSFIEPSVHALFAPDIKPMTLQNPLSQDMSVMRTSVWPGLLQALQMNVRYQRQRARLFEIGLCFLPTETELLQTQYLGFAVTGSVRDEQWSEKERSVDFYDLKADVMALLSLIPGVEAYHWKSDIHPALHPGRSAALYRRDQLVGWLGELHPSIITHFDMPQPVTVCEIALAGIRESDALRYQAFSRFPMVRRDLAVVLDENTSADEVKRIIAAEAGALLKSTHIFDVYQGKGIEMGKKSLALGLTFQDPSRTLKDEEINTIIHGVVTALTRELGATLRA